MTHKTLNNYANIFRVGDEVWVYETNGKTETKTLGKITFIGNGYIETIHQRNPMDTPNAGDWGYVPITTRHYGTKNIMHPINDEQKKSFRESLDKFKRVQEIIHSKIPSDERRRLLAEMGVKCWTPDLPNIIKIP